MITFVGEYYDGKNPRPHPVTIVVHETYLFLQGTKFTLDVPLSKLTVDPTVGSARTIIRLENDAEIHSSDREAVRALESKLKRSTPENIARCLENRLFYALGALVVTGIIIFSLFRWGLPALANYAAHTLPDETESFIGLKTLETLDRIYLDASKLPISTQKNINQKLHDLCSMQACPKFELLFRNSTAMGANAFALPDHHIVVTDQLVEKAEHDEEIIAVLFHELGHIKEKHILRATFQSVGSGIILVMITGDISNYSDLAAGIPAMLLQQGYSRDMEDEADVFALNALQKAHISPQRFADILLRIAPEDNATSSFLSTHPKVKERIKKFVEAAAKEKKI